MKRSWTAMAVTAVAIFAVAGCNDYGNTFQNNTGAFLTFLSPANLPAGGSAFTITMNGNGFVAQTKVQWNGKTCPTSSTNTNNSNCTTTVTLDANNNVISVTASIPASYIAKPGMAAVNTIQPASGAGQNGLSNTINFIINNPPNPVPAISGTSASCAVVGNSLALTVTGTNFLAGPTSSTPPQASTLTWTLGSAQAQFTSTSPGVTITSSQISVTIPATDVNVAGNASVTVSNPPSLPVTGIPGSTGSGGGTSPAATVTVQSSACPAAAKASSVSAEAAVAEETPAVNHDGRFVAYAAIQDGHSQIFFRDTCENAPAACQPRTTLLSVSSDGTAASGDSHAPSMSSDGRYVVFSSASSLVESAPPGRQIYLRDTCAGTDESCKPTTSLVSTDSNGVMEGTESILPSISSSGRFVAFVAVTPSRSASSASADAKVPGNSTNSGYRQIFVRDTCLGATNCTPKTTRISIQPSDGSGSTAKPAGPALGGSGKSVALTGGVTATLFKRSVPVDDNVFLAITGDQR